MYIHISSLVHVFTRLFMHACFFWYVGAVFISYIYIYMFLCLCFLARQDCRKEGKWDPDEKYPETYPETHPETYPETYPRNIPHNQSDVDSMMPNGVV